MWGICGSAKLKRSACFSEKMNLEAVPSLSASRAQRSDEVSAEPKPVVRVLLPTEPSCFPSPSKAEVHQPSLPIELSQLHYPSEVSGLSLPLKLKCITFYRPLRRAVSHPISVKGCIIRNCLLSRATFFAFHGSINYPTLRWNTFYCRSSRIDFDYPWFEIFQLALRANLFFDWPMTWATLYCPFGRNHSICQLLKLLLLFRSWTLLTVFSAEQCFIYILSQYQCLPYRTKIYCQRLHPFILTLETINAVTWREAQALLWYKPYLCPLNSCTHSLCAERSYETYLL